LKSKGETNRGEINDDLGMKNDEWRRKKREAPENTLQV
jgi:hypothetical protein